MIYFVELFLLFTIMKEMPPKNKMIKIQVQCYSGYKDDEKPISFILDAHKFMVERIFGRWRSPDFEYYKVLADDGKDYLLRNDYRNDDWSLEKIPDL